MGGIYFLRRYERKSALIINCILIIIMDRQCVPLLRIKQLSEFCLLFVIAMCIDNAAIMHPQLLANCLVYVPLT